MNENLLTYDDSPLQDFRDRPERWRNRVQSVLQNIAAERDLISPVQLFHTHHHLHAFRYLPSSLEQANSLVGSDMRTWDPRLLEALLMLPTRISNSRVVERIELEIRKRTKDSSDKREHVTYGDVAKILDKVMPNTANEDGWKETLEKNVQRYYGGNNSQKVSKNAPDNQIGVQGSSVQPGDNGSSYDEEGDENEDIYNSQENSRKRPRPEDEPGQTPSSKRPSSGKSQTSRIPDEAAALGTEDNNGEDGEEDDEEDDEEDGEQGYDEQGYDEQGYDEQGYDEQGNDGEENDEVENQEVENDEEENDEEDNDEEENEEEENEEEDDDNQQNLAANQASQAQPSPIPPLHPPPPPPPPPPLVQPPIPAALPIAPLGPQRVRRRTEAEVLAAQNRVGIIGTRTRRNGRVSPGKYKV